VAKLAGLMVVLGSLATLLGAFLPWVIGPDATDGSRLMTNLSPYSAIQVLLALMGVLVGAGLLLGGSGNFLGVTALLLAVPAMLVCPIALGNAQVVLAVSADPAHFDIVGPGPYVLGVGVVVWICGAVGALIASQPIRKTEDQPASALHLRAR
jgi:hypothetical protein